MAKKIYDWPVKATIINTETEARAYTNGVTQSQSVSAKETVSKQSVSESSFKEEAKRLKKQRETMALMREYSLPYDLLNPSPPFPGMVLNSGFMRWEPENLDEFIREHGESVRKYKTTQNGERSDVPTSKESSISSSEEVTIMTKTENNSGADLSKVVESPQKESLPKSKTSRSKTSESKPASSMNIPMEGTQEPHTPSEAIITDDVTTVTIPNDRNKGVVATSATPKATRISAKMRRASRKEFHDVYLVKTDTKGGKPITIAADLVERAYRICARSGDHRTCPTYLFNNLLRELLDVIEPDTEDWATLG